MGVIDFHFLQSNDFLYSVGNSLVLFLCYLAVRIVTVRTVSRLAFENAELKRKWIVYLKNITTVIFFTALAVIWASKLQTFALSLAAVAAAVAVTFKEYMLCVLGGVFKSSSNLFKVGDRIEIKEFRGDVIDHDFLTTTLLEIGPGHQLHQFTGKTLVIPNSLFLSNPLINETARTNIGLHSFEFPAYITDDLVTIENELLAAARAVTEPYVPEAQRVYHRLSVAEGIVEPAVEPRISVYFPEAHRVIFVVRFPTPIKRKGKTEQEIIRRFLKSVPRQSFSEASLATDPAATEGQVFDKK